MDQLGIKQIVRVKEDMPRVKIDLVHPFRFRFYSYLHILLLLLLPYVLDFLFLTTYDFSSHKKLFD